MTIGFLAAIAAPAQAAPAADGRAAEIVQLSGVGETRPESASVWSAARVKQGLFPSNFVRTGDLSRMSILFRDETQISLNQNSQLQIKAAPAPGQASPNQLRLNSGRAWTQSKRSPGGVQMETPAAIAAIRGTDWEMEVAPDGTSTLTVLSGEVEFFNDQGRLTVQSGEQAVAEVGRAPVKRLLVNARERVQWVTAHAVDPLRHVELTGRLQPGTPLELAWAALHAGDLRAAEARLAEAGGADGELAALARVSVLILSERLKPAEEKLGEIVKAGGLAQPAPWLMLADIALYAGDLAAARSWLEQAGKAFPGDVRVASLLAKVELAADNPGASRELVARAIAKEPNAVEPRLAAGSLARFEGQAAAAEAAFTAAVQLQPADDRGWYGRGAVRSERELVGPARADLDRALAIKPDGPGYRGELATLETFADRFGVASQEFARALEADPADYVALTGLGLLQLKRGRPQEALESFLRAGVIEPRYARAHTFAAVACYQLGRTDRALQELARASGLDPKDPLPHLFASIIHGDRFEPSAAVEESRTALRLMPYLKSLNQVANDQKGQANLGAALAFFGLEEWAQNYAQESYSPYWGGSHLFLGDRYPDGFAQSSEFTQGYLADPIAFGASNRFHSLVTRPGNYATLELLGSRVDADTSAYSTSVMPRVTLDGLATSPFPVAYFADAVAQWLEPSDWTTQVEGDARNLTAAVGAKPAGGFGLFVLGTSEEGSFDFDDPASGRTVPFTESSTRFDAGATYRFAPERQLWLKVGAGSLDRRIDDYPSGTDSTAFMDYTLEQSGREALVRHTVTVGAHEISIGAEYGELSALHRGEISAASLPAGTVVEGDFDDASQEIYLSDRFRIGPHWLLQGDLRYQRHEHDLKARLFAGDDPVSSADQGETVDKFNPSVGVVWRPGGAFVVRGAYQRWMRPFSTSTLGPVATAGIVLDDRFVNAGGTLQQSALKVEWEVDNRTFVTAGIDVKKIEGWSSADISTPGLTLDDISKLRNEQIYNLASGSFLEGTPEVGAGRLFSTSAAVNRIITRPWSVFVRYTYSSGENTTDEYDGNEVPYIAEHLAAAGSTLILPAGIQLNGAAVYQTERYGDEANLEPLAAGWNASLTAYFETSDKRWALLGGAGNLLSENWDTVYFVDVRHRF